MLFVRRHIDSNLKSATNFFNTGLSKFMHAPHSTPKARLLCDNNSQHPRVPLHTCMKLLIIPWIYCHVWGKVTATSFTNHIRTFITNWVLSWEICIIHPDV